MKKLLCITTIGIIFSVAAYAEDITVFDYSTGKYSYYEIERRKGKNIEVYDYKNKRFMEFEVEPNGDLYDWQKKKYYDVDMRSKGRSGTVYDYQENRFYDFEIER